MIGMTWIVAALLALGLAGAPSTVGSSGGVKAQTLSDGTPPPPPGGGG